jgi:hypothetical protein
MRHYTAAILITALFSCSQPVAEQNENSIYRIVMAQHGSFNPTAPADIFSIDSSLIVNYHGIENVRDSGHFMGQITIQVWRAIQKTLREMKYKEFEILYPYKPISDGHLYEIHIYHDSGEVHCETHSLPLLMDNMFDWIRTIALQSDLKKTNNAFDLRKENKLPHSKTLDTSYPHLQH